MAKETITEARPAASAASKGIALECVEGVWSARFFDTPQQPITLRDLNLITRTLTVQHRVHQKQRKLTQLTPKGA